MPVIHNKQCKVCNSEHRTEIEKLLAEGWGTRRISKWLKDKYNESISDNAILNHKKKHWNVSKEIKKRAARKESEELFEEEVKKGLTRLETLRTEREENFKLAKELRTIFFGLLKSGKWKRLHPETFKAMQSLYNTATNQVRYTAAEEFKQLDQDTEDPFVKLMELIKNDKGTNGDDSEEA
ncbi:hypothetical protein [Thermosipho melanesiensis]|uniref:Uncharacterized protein n=2 Tax=Thermosipho melanesiensis TaxID=46541 RepID=A6LN09_THEM4|nr:hypothetical protein [Thermosipho melanesiensis]ABR31310.1 hypothetical protein Tmel_1463 [Thermosipho melanesiensis BI429]APT74384.1 hypothetical protein BW47_07755 [Thermosipho melanesiensis]